MNSNISTVFAFFQLNLKYQQSFRPIRSFEGEQSYMCAAPSDHIFISHKRENANMNNKILFIQLQNTSYELYLIQDKDRSLDMQKAVNLIAPFIRNKEVANHPTYRGM